MLELHEIEELFKSEELVKNKAMIHALLRNAALLHREGITEEQKKLALENIKNITHGGQPKVKKPKAEKVPKADPQHVKLKYSPAYEHYGIKKEHWEAATPDAHKELFDHHNAVMAGKIPGTEHIKNAVEQARAQGMKKSLDRLYDIFSELKKRI